MIFSETLLTFAICMAFFFGGYNTFTNRLKKQMNRIKNYLTYTEKHNFKKRIDQEKPAFLTLVIID